MEPRVVTMHETNARDVFDTVETDGRLPLVLSQIHTARVSKRAFVLRINTGLLAMKARWLSATQSKQGRSEIRFPDLTHWPVNCCGSQWYSKLDPWHTFKRSFFSKSSYSLKSDMGRLLNLYHNLYISIIHVIPHWQVPMLLNFLPSQICGK